MKLKQLFENNRAETVPVEIDYTHETENENDKITFELEVTITPDGYGTGDSPTDYQVHITDAFYKNDHAKKFNWKKELNSKEVTWIEDKAIRKAQS
jgi:hypothetical protein